MMKRFDHHNIMQLLAVCTIGEPAYTIMEFMLHGKHLPGRHNTLNQCWFTVGPVL